MNDRKDDILRLIIEHYIKNVKPVSSSSLCEILNCSSATIRNDMAMLEDMGYLEKEHISSGRIPSEKGYRYYVDNLMKPKEITGEDMLKLQTIFSNNQLELSDVITKSMQIVSQMTNYASVVLGDTSTTNFLTKIEIVPIDSEKFVSVIITDTGYVEHKTMIKPVDVHIDEVRKTVDLINKLIIGTRLDLISEKLEFEIKPIISNYVMKSEILYDTFYNAFKDFSVKNNVFFTGKNNIIKQPEFNNVEKIRHLMDKFEDNNNFTTNIIEDNGEVKIYIGNENSLDEDVTIIKTKYETEYESGVIAIVGPKRMEYDRIVMMLDYIKSNIERRGER